MLTGPGVADAEAPSKTVKRRTTPALKMMELRVALTDENGVKRASTGDKQCMINHFAFWPRQEDTVDAWKGEAARTWSNALYELPITSPERQK